MIHKVCNFQFLTKLHLMDYSLLLGVHECGRGEAEAEAARQLADQASDDTDTDSDTEPRHDKYDEHGTHQLTCLNTSEITLPAH